MSKGIIKKLVVLLGACSMLFASSTICAAVLADQPVTLKQPDGTVLECLASGDEHFNFLHDADGFLIKKDPKTGNYTYVKYEDDEFVSTSIIAKTGVKLGESEKSEVANKNNLKLSEKTLKKYGHYEMAEASEQKQLGSHQTFAASSETPHSDKSVMTVGDYNNIVILIRFSDESGNPNPEFYSINSDLRTMFSNSEKQSYSLRAEYKRFSFDKLHVNSYFASPTEGTVTSYVAPHTQSYYAESNDRKNELLADAIEAVINKLPTNVDYDKNDDGYFDNITYIYDGDTGDWASTLWPHQSSYTAPFVADNGLKTGNYILINSRPSLRTIVHEFGHTLGMPDLYHYNIPVTGTRDLCQVDQYDLMCSGTEFILNYMKRRYTDWLDGGLDEMDKITTSGHYTLQSAGGQENNAYYVQDPNLRERYIIEYQYTEGYRKGSFIVYRANDALNWNYSGSDAPYYAQDEVFVYDPCFKRTSVMEITDKQVIPNADCNEMRSKEIFSSEGTPAPFSIYNIKCEGQTASFDVRFNKDDILFNVPSGQKFYGTLNIKPELAEGEGQIYYTLDGSEPTMESTLYNPDQPIAITDTTTLKCRSFNGETPISNVISNTYIKEWPESEHPFKKYTQDSWVTSYPGACAVALSFDEEASSEGHGLGMRVKDENGEVIARGMDSDLAGKSFIIPGEMAKITCGIDDFPQEYGFKVKEVTPYYIHFNYPDGLTFYGPINVEASIVDDKDEAISGVDLYYTTDGTEPTTESNLYTPGTPIKVTRLTTFKFKGFVDGKPITTSKSVTYTNQTRYLTTNYGDERSIKFSDQLVLEPKVEGEPEATIYYTTDGTLPTPESTAYVPGKPIVLKETTALTLAGYRCGVQCCREVTIDCSKVANIETDHNYYPRTHQLWVVDKPGCKSITFKFNEQFDLEERYVTLKIMDENGKEIAGSPFSGTSLAGKELTVPGSQVTMIFQSGMGYMEHWGFKIDEITGNGENNNYEVALNVPDEFTFLEDFDLTPEVKENGAAVDGVDIYYTTDGTEPNAESNLYTPGTPIKVHYTTTLKFVGMVDGKPVTPIKTATYSYRSKLVSTNYGDERYIKFTDELVLAPKFEDDDVTFYYTTDGSNPTTDSSSCKLGETLTIKDTATLQIAAFHYGVRCSTVNVIDCTKVDTVETEHNYPSRARYFWVVDKPGSQSITMKFNETCDMRKDFARLQIMDENGEEIEGSPFVENQLANKEITVKGSKVTLLFSCSLGYADNWGFKIDSIETDVRNGQYEIELNVPDELTYVVGPQLTPEVKSNGEAVGEATIYYTTDGSTPNLESNVYTPGTPIQVERTGTFKFIGVIDGKIVTPVKTAKYTYDSKLMTTNLGEQRYVHFTDKLAITPVFEEEDAAFYYTLDGTEPTTDSTAYVPGEPIMVEDTAKLQIAAFHYGVQCSKTLPIECTKVDTVETEHNYPSRASYFWVVDKPGAESVTLNFNEQCDIEEGYARLKITDENGNEIEGSPFDGAQLASKSITIRGSKVYLEFTSSLGNAENWGFKIDSIETDKIRDVVTLNLPHTDRLKFYDQLVVVPNVEDADATICYTTDGSTPTAESMVYVPGQPVVLYNSATLTFAAFKDGVQCAEAVSVECERTYSMESAHNYGPDDMGYWIVDEPDAESITLNFSVLTNLDSNCSEIEITDAEGNQVSGSPFTSSMLAQNRITVPGSRAIIKFTSNGSNDGFWGFRVDEVHAN